MTQSASETTAVREDWQVILWASFIAQTFSIIGFSASLPFIPLYLVKDLGITNVSEAGLWAGAMAAGSALVMAGVAPIWGVLGDRYGRKSMVLRAMIGGFITIGLMAICNNVWLLLLLRIIQGALTGTVPANIALIASVTPKRRLGFALGVIQTAVFAGASLGPLVGGTLADLTDYRFTFVVTSVALGLAALVVTFFVHENFVPVLPDPQARKPGWSERLHLAFGEKIFVAMLLILSLIQFANSVIQPVLALFVKELNGTVEGAATLAGLELGITGFTSAISAALLGQISDRLGHRRILVICALGAALLYFPQTFVTNIWQLLILRGLMGLFFGGVIPASNAIIAQLIPDGRKGAAYGLVSSFGSLGFAIGPITGATLAALINTRAVFLLTGVILLITAWWVYRVLGFSSRSLSDLEPVKSSEPVEMQPKP